MRRRFLPVLLVAATLILATGALVHGQASKAQPSTPQALREREAECEARLQAIYRLRGEVVGKVYSSAEAKAADWQQLETALQVERTCLTQTDEALVKALTSQEAECQKLTGRRPPGSNDDSRDAARSVEQSGVRGADFRHGRTRARGDSGPCSRYHAGRNGLRGLRTGAERRSTAQSLSRVRRCQRHGGPERAADRRHEANL